MTGFISVTPFCALHADGPYCPSIRLSDYKLHTQPDQKLLRMLYAIAVSTLCAVIVILFLAAFGDVKYRRIPNSLSLLLVALFCVFALSMHLMGGEINILNSLIAGGAMLIGGLILFALGAMGGGDVKLAAALSLFAGTKYIIPLLILIALLGGLVAVLTWAHSKLFAKENKVDAPNLHSVPYGVAISISGVWLCIQLLEVVGFVVR